MRARLPRAHKQSQELSADRKAVPRQVLPASMAWLVSSPTMATLTLGNAEPPDPLIPTLFQRMGMWACTGMDAALMAAWEQSATVASTTSGASSRVNAARYGPLMMRGARGMAWQERPWARSHALRVGQGHAGPWSAYTTPSPLCILRGKPCRGGSAVTVVASRDELIHSPPARVEAKLALSAGQPAA